MKTETQTTKVRRKVAQTCAEQIIHLLDVGHVNDIIHFIEGAIAESFAHAEAEAHAHDECRAKLAAIETEVQKLRVLVEPENEPQ